MSLQNTLPLNPEQQRKLGASLRLLCEDLERLLYSADAARYAGGTLDLMESIQSIIQVARGLLQELGLATDRPVSFSAQVVATAEVWIARLEDLKAHRLVSYGPLPVAAVSRVLDPHLERLQRALAALTEAAGGTVLKGSFEVEGG